MTPNTMKTLCITTNEAKRLLDAGEVMIVRPMKPQPIGDIDNLGDCETIIDSHGNYIKSPFGHPGTLVSLRETWAIEDPERLKMPVFDGGQNPGWIYYREPVHENTGLTWRSPATMPSWAIRPAFRDCEVVVVECRKVAEIARDEIDNTGCPILPLAQRNDGYQRAQDFEQCWSRRYGKLYPFDSTWAWFAKVKMSDPPALPQNPTRMKEE